MKAVIFDFDGTVADSLPALIHLYERVGGKRVRSEKKDIEKLRSKSMLQVALALGVPKWRIVWLAVFGRSMFRRHIRSIAVYAGVQELLIDLRSNGVKLYVVSTNHTSNVQDYLKRHELDQFFDGIFGGANFLSKANLMRRVLRQNHLAAKDVWCVGDEKIDIRSARGAGMRIISVTWGYSSREGLSGMKPDKLVDSTSELRKALGLPRS